MTERRKDFIHIAVLFALLMLFFSRILFTDKIIRAPDIINEAYWWMQTYNDLPLSELYPFNLKASWDILLNSGFTNEGGMSSMQFLLHLPLILHFIPAPASVAWFIVLHLFFGAVGMYCCCRLINTSRIAALLAALIFALATENASLINAGHVMKIATISYAPWAFFCLEKGFLSKRIFWFMATALVLAFQFFNTHWQVAYYTCLCVGMYGIIRSITIVISEQERASFKPTRLLGCNLVVLLFFLSTVAISLVPLANWSKDTNRGVHSGANQGKGGLDRDEAMSWSLPPEEAVAFVIPGFFGFSRQEAGPNPDNITSYYWGRMFFTQTASYMGLLPWLLVPLPLIFRRDKYTLLAMIGIAGGILFSMGKYTPFYNLLFDYFPGINRFRVPKMIMFIPVIGLGVLSARGLDLLLDHQIRTRKAFQRYLAGLTALPIAIMLSLGILQVWKLTWLNMFIDELSTPTRYEEGSQLVLQRWSNLVSETGLAAALAAITAWVIVFGSRLRKNHIIYLPVILICIYLTDVWRVNDKFMFLVDAPHKVMSAKTPAMEFISRSSNQFRTLPLDGGDPMRYASNRIPVMFTSNAVQQQRWQEIIDIFNLNTAMPDMLNVKYLVYPQEQYSKDKATLSDKYQPVFQSPDNSLLVLENRSVLPKAWLASSVQTVTVEQALKVLQTADFDPSRTALVESPPPIQLEDTTTARIISGKVSVKKYSGEQILITAVSDRNSLLVLGEKYYRGWKAYLDGKETAIIPVNHILRGAYLPPGKHTVEFLFDPLPFKIGKYLTLLSFVFFAVMFGRELLLWRNSQKKAAAESR